MSGNFSGSPINNSKINKIAHHIENQPNYYKPDSNLTFGGSRINTSQSPIQPSFPQTDSSKNQFKTGFFLPISQNEQIKNPSQQLINPFINDKYKSTINKSMEQGTTVTKTTTF